MEPFSAAATAISVADTALKLVNALVGYSKDVKNASTEKKLLVEELLALEGLLQRLVDRESAAAGKGGTSQLGELNRRLKAAYDDLAISLNYDSGIKALRSKGRLRSLAALAKWPFTKEDIYAILQRVSRLQDTCQLLLADEQQILLQSLDDKQQAADRRRLKNDVSQWLSSLNMAQTHQAISSRAAPNSGRWFTKSEAIFNWSSGLSRLLWCHGMLGAGKTILASVTVDYLRQEVSASPSSARNPIAVLYLKYNEPDQSIQNLLGSVVKQIIQDSSTVPSSVMELYSQHGDGSSMATAEELVTLILELLSDDELFLVIDGLDECKEELRWILLEHLDGIRSKTRILIFSRFIDGLAEDLQDYHQFEVKASRTDIEVFIDQQIRNNRNLRRLVDKTPSLREDIKNQVFVTAAGMFLLVRLHMESIGTAAALSIRRVRDRLSTLPTELSGAFDDAMKRIEGQESEQKTIAVRTLAWITHVFRPLSMKELQHALAFEPAETHLDEELILEGHNITNLCAGLVVIDQSTNEINLVHFSAMHYFKTNCSKFFPQFHAVITLSCASFLMLPMIGGLTIHQILQDFPLAYYAAQYLGDHAREAPEEALDEPVVVLLCRLFSHTKERKLLLSLLNGLNLMTAGGKGLEIVEEIVDQVDIPGLGELGSPIFEDSMQGNELMEQAMPAIESLSLAMDMFDESKVGDFIEGTNSRLVTTDAQFKKVPEVTALHLAASMGLARVAAMLMAGTQHIDAVDASGKTALTVAVEKGFGKAVELLLCSGASVDLNTIHGRTILLLVVERNWDSAVAAIVSNAKALAAEAVTEDQMVDASFILAILNGETEKLSALMKALDMSTTGPNVSEFGLILAVELQQLDLVEQLLKLGVSVDAKDTNQQTPLFRATKRRNHQMMRLLLQYHAMVDWKDENEQTPWAANIRCDAITLSILLDAGADPNTKGLQGSNMLYIAASEGDIAVVRYMLAHGTNPSISTDHLWASLHWSAWNGHYQVVEELIAAGANLSPVSTSGLTPLDLALQAGQTKIIKLLQQKGAQEAKSLASTTPVATPNSKPPENASPSDTVDTGKKTESTVKPPEKLTFYFEKPTLRALINPQFLGQTVRTRLGKSSSGYLYQISNCLDLAQKSLSIRTLTVADTVEYCFRLSTMDFPLPDSLFDAEDVLYDISKTGASFELRDGRQASRAEAYSMAREWTADWKVSGIEQNGNHKPYLLRTSHDWSTSSKDDCRWMLQGGALVARSGYEAGSPKLSLVQTRTDKGLQDLLVACWVTKLWAETLAPKGRDHSSLSSVTTGSP